MDAVAQYVMSRFLRYGLEKYGLVGRFERFNALVRGRVRGRCISEDVFIHYIDDIYIKLLNNMYKEVRIRSGDEVFVFDDVDDPIVTDNMVLLPAIFSRGWVWCPATNGTCASSPPSPCLSPMYYIQSRIPHCNSSNNSYGLDSGAFVDNLPWINNYSSGTIGLSVQVPTTPGVVVMTFGFTVNACFPSSGVTLYGPVISVGFTNVGQQGCVTSCGSGTQGLSIYANYCPGFTYSTRALPVLYFDASIVAYPNASYSAWVKFQFS